MRFFPRARALQEQFAVSHMAFDRVVVVLAFLPIRRDRNIIDEDAREWLVVVVT